MGTSTRTTYTSAFYILRLTFYENGGDTVPGYVDARRTTNASSVSLSVSIPSQVPTRTNYRFLGYSTSATGVVEYQPGDTISRTFSRSATLTNTSTYYDDATGNWVTVYEYTSHDQGDYRSYYALWELAVETPSITSQPSNVTTYVGGTANLSVTASVGTGTLSYQWQSSDNNSTWSNISGETSSSYSASTAAIGTR